MLKVKKGLVAALLETEYFKSIDDKRQKYFLKGDNAFFTSREDLEIEMGRDKNNFKLLYKLFSSNTHSFPMGFYGMLEGRILTGVGTKVEVNYSAFSLTVSEEYIKMSCIDMTKLFPDILSKLSSNEKSLIE